MNTIYIRDKTSIYILQIAQFSSGLTKKDLKHLIVPCNHTLLYYFLIKVGNNNICFIK